MTCSKCGGQNCMLIQESESESKGFGVCKGLCGYFIIGPLGLLCGLCGMGKGKTKTKHYWICNSCGNKFRA